MKFAKELEQDLVPEWRAKYLDYKQGKKYVKVVTRAINRANATPRTPARSAPALTQKSSKYGATSPFIAKRKPTPALGRSSGQDEEPETVDPLRDSPTPFAIGDSRAQSNVSFDDPFKMQLKKTPPMPIARNNHPPELPELYYGSFVPTPPLHSRPFELPDPAVSPETPLATAFSSDSDTRPPNLRSASVAVPQNAYEAGLTISPHRSTFASLRHRPPYEQTIRPFIRRMFSVGAPLTPEESARLQDVNLIAHDQVKAKQKEFFNWMDRELDKIESFYRLKEDEAEARSMILRDQLHEMRNRRIQELADMQHAKKVRKEDEQAALHHHHGSRSNGHPKDDENIPRPTSRDHLQAWLNPLGRVIGDATATVLRGTIGDNSRALQNMHESPELRTKKQANIGGGDGNRDYVRRPRYDHEVPYRSAKRKLKLALQEFYRSMELLKSYSLLNRTAFRKINKKYDKAVNAHPPLRYMAEKVNTANFVTSTVLDEHMHNVEDLYARYFERGNHKIATGKLRSGQGRPGDQSASAFRNGVLIGTGAVFAIQGVVYGAELLHHQDLTIRTQASYLLQIYGGYFLGLYLFSWFCLDCSIWTRNKINYQFVFEFDPRHNLDWRQLGEIPSFLILLLGVFVWLNFSQYGYPVMFIYYPVILIGLTTAIIFMPAPIIFHRSRRWFVYSHWRLILAGLYPVEFRDFFLGDMYCSLTYLMANIELFFCLYANDWNNPSQCNSTHSRLLGFFSALPSIWRALQCIRRYYDTRNIFPHLVNCGKYAMGIMFYVTLSLYRIQRNHSMLALFSTFAIVNSIYCSIWDIVMDWSLFQPQAKRRFLRDVRGYKNPYWYYFAMVLDPILRFNWIFYSIYTHDLQHSTIVSFLVGFSEVTRRGMWTLFRVENEHCSNVAHFKAARDIPLPYDIEADAEASDESLQQPLSPEPTSSSPALSRHRSRTTGALEPAADGSTLRRRQPPTRTFTKILADAHTQDFEKKRKPGGGDSDNVENMKRDGSPVGSRSNSSDDDDDEEDEQAVLDAETLGGERRRYLDDE